MVMSNFITLMMIIFFLLNFAVLIQLSTATETNDAVIDVLPNVVVETNDSENAFSSQRSSILIDCRNLEILKKNQKCSFNNLFIQLLQPKKQGTFGQVWKATYSSSRFGGWSDHHLHFAAIKFIKYSHVNAYLAAAEIDILLKMYQDRVEHVAKIIPDLTSNISAVDITFTAKETDSININYKWIMIGMEYYDIDLDEYSIKNARTSNFDIYLLIANLMVCTVRQLIFSCMLIVCFSYCYSNLQINVDE